MYKNWFWNPICPDYFQLSVRLIASPCLISSHKILFAPFNPRFSDTFFLNLALGVFATQGKWEDGLKSDHRKFCVLCSVLFVLCFVLCALCYVLFVLCSVLCLCSVLFDLCSVRMYADDLFNWYCLVSIANWTCSLSFICRRKVDSNWSSVDCNRVFHFLCIFQ